jgi:hypothetical protein
LLSGEALALLFVSNLQRVLMVGVLGLEPRTNQL